MAVKVGNSYVSEAAYNFATSTQVEDDGGGNILKELSQKFSGLKISVGTAPFSGTGTNNVSISPKILKEMQENPDKRVEYEALLYDIATLNNPLPGVKSSGFIIGDDGGLRGWGISESGGNNHKASTKLNKSNPKSWWQKLLDELNEKSKKSAEVEISDEGLAAQKKSESKETTTTETSKGAVAFNASKRARQLAAAASRDDVNAVMELLQQDLRDCKDGLQKGMCDEQEVKKVEAMIERAKKRLNEVGENDNSDVPNISPIDIII